MKYILDKLGNPVLETDVLKWARWYEKADRLIVEDKIGEVLISTVFLGLDHSFGLGLPLLYETMIFGGKHNQFQERYSTRDKTIAGHTRALEWVKTGENQWNTSIRLRKSGQKRLR